MIILLFQPSYCPDLGLDDSRLDIEGDFLFIKG